MFGMEYRYVYKSQNYRVEILVGTTFNGPTLIAWVMWLHGKEDKFLRGI